MTPEETASLLQILTVHRRQIADHQASKDAIVRMIGELIPIVSPEATAVLPNYSAYRAENWETAMLALETKHPSLAAELDKARPPLPPTEPTAPAS